MNIEKLVKDFQVSYQSAVRASGAGERLPDTTDVNVPVIWANQQGNGTVVLVALNSYDYSASARGLREYVGFTTGCGLWLQFIIEDGEVSHDLFSPVHYN